MIQNSFTKLIEHQPTISLKSLLIRIMHRTIKVRDQRLLTLNIKLILLQEEVLKFKKNIRRKLPMKIYKSKKDRKKKD
jgi:hypothetical protein